MKSKLPVFKAAKLVEAARLRANGLSFAAVSKAVGCTETAFKAWRDRNEKIWEAALDAATVSVVDSVRKLAGTPAMLANIEAFAAAAESASRWCSQPGKPELFKQPLRPEGAEHTLRTFFESYYVKVCMADPSPESVGLYRKQLSKWELLTGNPPLKAIEPETLAMFRDAMITQPHHQKPKRKLSLWTVRAHLRTIQTMLDHAGPPSQRNRDAAGFIAVVPWCKLPRAEMPVPKIISNDSLSKCYAAAPLMEWPMHGSIKPAAWWRALLVLTFNTGMRRRTLFGLKWSDVDFRKRVITVRPEISKSRKRQVVPMNVVVTSHLLAIQRKPDDYVFHVPANWQRYRQALFLLQKLAGIDKREWFQLHRLRKTCATVLWAKDPGAASLMLGHSSLSIARDHYVNAPAALIDASEAMPQPKGFDLAGREAGAV